MHSNIGEDFASSSIAFELFGGEEERHVLLWQLDVRSFRFIASRYGSLRGRSAFIRAVG